jgi:hypothetical protein
MAIINTNGSFTASGTVTSTTLNAVADGATFNDPVDETTLELITSGPDDGKLRIKTGGVDTNQIAGSAVTRAKIENVADMKVLGNTSGSAAAPQEVDVLDEDDMTSDSPTALATQQSIKAYVDALEQYQLKYSGSTGTKSVTTSFADWDLSSVVGSNRAMVIIELRDSSTFISLFARTKNSSVSPYNGNSFGGWGTSGLAISSSNVGGTIVVITNESGIIEIKGSANASDINYTIQAYQKLA